MTPSTLQESGDNSDVASSSPSPCRQWREFWDVKSLSLPESPLDATTRLIQNITHFQVNYLYVLILIPYTYATLIDFSIIMFIVFVTFILACCFIFYKYDDRDSSCFRYNSSSKTLGLTLVLQSLNFGLGRPWIYSVYLLVIYVMVVCLHGMLRVPIYDQYQGLLDSQPRVVDVI